MNESMPSRARWVILGAIWITYVINYLDRVSVLVFLPIIREDLHFTHIQIAQAASVFFLAYSMTLLFLGWTSDRFRPTFMMKLAISIFSIVTFFTGLMRVFYHFVIIRILLGFGEGLHFPSILRTIGNWFPKNEKGRAVAIFATSWGIGPAFIPILVTWLATVIGGWRPVFMVLFIPGFIAILLVTLFIFDSPDIALRRKKVSEQEYNYIESGLVKIKGETGLSFKRQLGIVLGDPSFCFYCLMMFCQSGAFWGSTAWLSSFLYEQHKFKLVEMGAMASLPYVAGTCAMLTAGWSMDRILWRKSQTCFILLICANRRRFLFRILRAGRTYRYSRTGAHCPWLFYEPAIRSLLQLSPSQVPQGSRWLRVRVFKRSRPVWSFHRPAGGRLSGQANRLRHQFYLLISIFRNIEPARTGLYRVYERRGLCV